MLRRMALIMVACGCVLLSVAARRHREPGSLVDAKVLTAPSARRDIAVTVVASGELEAARSTVISSRLRASATVLTMVADGARVRAGDVLVRFDPTPFEEELASAAAEVQRLRARAQMSEQAEGWQREQAAAELAAAAFDVEAARLDLEQLEHGDGPLELAGLERAVAEAKEKHRQLTSYVADLVELEKRGFANPAESVTAGRKADEAGSELALRRDRRDRYRDHVLPTAMKKAAARIERAELELERVKKAVAFQVAKAEAQLSQARAEVDLATARAAAAEAALADTVVAAPMPGLAVVESGFHDGQRRKVRVGDSILRGQPLVYLPDVTRMQVRVRVREIELNRVAVNMTASVRIDAFPELVLAGRVQAIGVLAEAVAGEREKSFQVTIACDAGDDRLRPGMTARVAIHSATVEGALSVPLAALFDDGAGGYEVFVDRGTGFERRPVSVGLMSDELAAINQGLESAELVALSRPGDEALR